MQLALLTAWALLIVAPATVSGTDANPVQQPIRGVIARATSSQSGPFDPQNVCRDSGLSDAGDGRWKLTTNAYIDGGTAWQSAYLRRGPEEQPIIEFDLGRQATVGRFHLWNQNGNPSRGFKDVSVTISTDGSAWHAVAQRFLFAAAPNSDDYLGEDYFFTPPVTARYIRLHCDSTHRSGGNPDIAGIAKIRFYEAEPAPEVGDDPLGHYPRATGFIDVRRPPYSAAGDGQTDDTAALQRAIDDWQGRHRVLYFPPGTYRLTGSLRFRPGQGHGYNNILGAGRERTILRLDDNLFTSTESPQPVLSLGFNGQENGRGVHADWFNNNVSDLSVDTGRGNPGAIGLQFYSNNVGSLRRVSIRSSDGRGAVGLNLAYADQNGPLLVQHVSVDGFDIGVLTGATVNSQTFEHVRIRGAKTVGWENRGQCLAIRRLDVDGHSPAFNNRFGVVALIDAELGGGSMAVDAAAITNGETLFARNVRTTGFKSAIHNARERDQPTADAVGPVVDEWVSTPPLALFNTGQPRSLQLPVEETPDLPWDEPSGWANVRCFRRLEDPDDTAAVQRAIDSGAPVVYFPSGSTSFLSHTVEIRGPVRRIVGCHANLVRVRESEPVTSDAREAPLFRLGAGDSPIVVVEDVVARNVSILHDSERTLVVRNAQGLDGELSGGGRLFLENVVADWEFVSGQAWARQFNNERLGTHIRNAGATLWILGLKTERGGTLIETLPGARTELLGGLSYTTNNGKLAPMFVVRDADASFTIGEVCYSRDPYRTLLEETRAGETRTLPRGEAPLRASYLQGSEIPLYSTHLQSP